MIDLNIIRIIFSFDTTKDEKYNSVLNEFISCKNKLRVKTRICSICNQDNQNKYKYYDEFENRIRYKTDCICYSNRNDEDNYGMVGLYDDYEEDKIKLILALNNGKDIKKFQKNILKFISEKNIGDIEYEYQYLNQTIRKISIDNIHNEVNKIIYFFRKYVVK